MVNKGAIKGDQGVATEGAVEGPTVTMPGEANIEKAIPGNVTMGDGNPKK